MHKHLKFTYIYTKIPEYSKSLGSTWIGMRPNLWASTSSWTIDVLLATRTFSIAIVGTYIKKYRSNPQGIVNVERNQWENANKRTYIQFIINHS